MSTIKDVARSAGVSVATVSRVLNNDKAVVQSTRDRVLQTIEEIGYHPNLLGRNLRRSETKNIMVLIPTISNQFYSSIVKGVEEKAKDHGYKIFVCMTHAVEAEEKDYLDLLKARLVDGVIFLEAKLSAREITAIGKKYPIVQCCEYVKNSKTSIVSIEDEKAGYDAAEYLIGLGHKKIAFFGTRLMVTSAILREKGFCSALLKNGITVDESLFYYDTYSYNSGKRSTDKLLASGNVASAIFTIADSIAIGTVKRLIERGFQIPDDIAVIGFDNNKLSELYNPSISTVSQPQQLLGNTAMMLLLKKIKNNSSEDHVIKLDHEIIIRQTTEKGNQQLKSAQIDAGY
jgi:LacI family repressor for deo operon, udp, cdd, tsx, nupC, and nupG